jgi:phosphopantothenate synthetase
VPHCGISVNGEYNALRHECQEIFAALRQKFLINLFYVTYKSIGNCVAEDSSYIRADQNAAERQDQPKTTMIEDRYAHWVGGRKAV